MSKKKSRKELLKEEDAFLAAANQSVEWVDQHKSMVIVGTILLALGVAGTVGGSAYLDGRDQDSSALLTEALKVQSAELLLGDGQTKADPSGDPPTYPSEKAKWSAVHEAMRKVVSQAPTDGVRNLARFYGADASSRLGDLARAESEFKALQAELAPTDALFSLAVERLAYIQEDLERVDEAIVTLQSAQKAIGAGFYTDYLGYQLGRLYLNAGNVDEARATFQRVETNFPESSVRQQVKERLASLDGEGPALNEAGK